MSHGGAIVGGRRPPNTSIAVCPPHAAMRREHIDRGVWVFGFGHDERELSRRW